MKKYLLIGLLLLTSPLMLSAQRNDGAVIPGDFADPSIIKVKSTYFAVGTSSEWAPHFPIYRSADLKNWYQSGYVFDKAPDWTSGSFWAPEYYKIKNTYYIYYTARRKSDNASYIGVATSKYPDKEFKDHGVLIAFGKEAIDAFVFNDGGQLYITFKAYGLDKRPIELLASKLSADGLKLEGNIFSLLKDEQRLGMEGQSILKKDGYYYLFYSAGNCCGIQCSYNVQVARAKGFSGPYELYAGNPVLAENNKWKCMGHGTFVTGESGNYYYLHHAYNKESSVLTGRQALLSELVWPENSGWPRFKPQQVVGNKAPDIIDKFMAPAISKFWQWDFRHATPDISQQKGVLYLSGNVKPDNQTGVVLTSRPVSGSFVMNVTVLNYNEALKGLSFYGDVNAALGIGIQNNRVLVWQISEHNFSVLAEAPVLKEPAQLRLELTTGKRCKFYYQQGKKGWLPLLTADTLKVDALPQWDRSPRIGLHFKGDSSLNAQFANFSILMDH
ncbi:glycoside hydrolase family 43 protein [Mucilaginibacter sabulilitoris]|uniref:Glycoside hydrolase family 43 protein n=1 Tax=Mucilaginibacter sabulilitoris TaxID=1173583 RepID=A0ABZ0TGM7_9SPHI|nr:glycoside hydrolase family 43 protein [Mucilaginibacter sabulilitoris]WPU91567.1 glycoside hydrolase family 43 protein [Mucilaginibacter sabulilitoris]